jgi:predicted nucleic acid-binding protein
VRASNFSVSDLSPVTALKTVGQAELPRQLFGEAVIPPAVKAELKPTHPDFPGSLEVRQLSDRAQALGFSLTNVKDGGCRKKPACQY